MTQIPPEPILTMGAMLRSSSGRYADADALVFPDCRLSYRELEARARDWARTLIALGVKPGQNVGILLPTCPQFIEIFYGIVMIGAIVVPVNARYQANELGYLVENADIVVMITTGHVTDTLDFGARLTAALPSLAGAIDPQNLSLPEAPVLRTVICLDADCPPYLQPASSALLAGEQVDGKSVDARIGVPQRPVLTS